MKEDEMGWSNGTHGETKNA